MPKFPGWVIKLGGSLGAGPDTRAWLAALAACPQPVIVVPGGGRFADAIRAAQAALGFPEATAHAMAVLAMAQQGLLLLSLAPTLRVARGLGQLAASPVAPGAVTLWLPELDDLPAIEAAGLPANWTVTSDTLAAFVAARVGSRAVALVKRAPAPVRGPWEAAGLAQLAQTGFVDPCLSRFPIGCPLHFFGADEADAFLAWAAQAAP